MKNNGTNAKKIRNVQPLTGQAALKISPLKIARA
jgi:hypothetical protein